MFMKKEVEWKLIISLISFFSLSFSNRDTAIIMMFLSIILNAMLNNNNNKMYTVIEKANERGGFSIKNMFYVVFFTQHKRN